MELCFNGLILYTKKSAVMTRFLVDLFSGEILDSGSSTRILLSSGLTIDLIEDKELTPFYSPNMKISIQAESGELKEIYQKVQFSVYKNREFDNENIFNLQPQLKEGKDCFELIDPEGRIWNFTVRPEQVPLGLDVPQENLHC